MKTPKPDNPLLDMDMVSQIMHERRRVDKLRRPDLTDTVQVRRDMYAMLHLVHAGTRDKKVLESQFPETTSKYPKLVDLCMTCTTEDQVRDFLVVLDRMLKQIEMIQSKATTVEDSTDAVEMFLGKRYLKPAASH